MSAPAVRLLLPILAVAALASSNAAAQRLVRPPTDSAFRNATERSRVAMLARALPRDASLDSLAATLPAVAEAMLRSRVAERPAIDTAVAVLREQPQLTRAIERLLRDSLRVRARQRYALIALLGGARRPDALPLLTQLALDDSLDTPLGPEEMRSSPSAALARKAVQGIAFLRSPQGDSVLARIIRSRAPLPLRAEAADAMLWNHGDSAAVRDFLRRIAAPELQPLIGRPRFSSETDVERLASPAPITGTPPSTRRVP